MSRFTLVAVVAFVFAAALSPAAIAGPDRAGVGADSVAVCPPPDPGYARCFSRRQIGQPFAAPTSRPTGLRPRQVKRAYDFPTSNLAGRGETIVIVGAFHAPNAERNLRVFSRQFDLPLCTVANGCFRLVFARGTQPPQDPSQIWPLEADLDLQWAHAIAPGAKLILVEASSNNFVDLFQAVQVAAALGDYVSMSWGGPEFALEVIFEPLFNRPGVSFFAASGDTAQVSYPSASPQVISVGGTRLELDDGEFEAETAWVGGGGGCSVFFAASAVQAGFAEYPQAGCDGQRATPDLSLVADPETGVSLYTTFGPTGWFVLAGTSVSSPMAAGAAAVTRELVDEQFVYGDEIDFRDITVGFNAGPCLIGFDLCSGRGSWLGDDDGGGNRAPAASNDSYSMTQGTTLNVPAPGVLGNDTDADSEPLTASKTSDPGNGTLSFPGDGSFSYTPSAVFTGSVSFTYRANDGTTLSNTATVNITVNPSGGGGSGATFTPLRDTFVRSNFPNESNGSVVTLRAYKSGSSQTHTYLMFTVSGLSGSASAATLRLLVKDASPAGGALYTVSDTGWSEGTMTWNTKPALGSFIANVGAAALNAWVEIDVSSIVTGNGTYSFAVTGLNSDAAWYSSKEGTNPPQLVVVP